MRTLHGVLAILAVAVLTSCSGGGSSSGENAALSQVPASARQVDGKIYLGDEIDQLQAPQMVRLEIQSSAGTSTCSGTVIGANSVLTTTHCFLSEGISSVLVFVLGRYVAATEVLVAPGFGSDGTAIFNDLAIVRTGEALGAPAMPIMVSAAIQPFIPVLAFGFGLDENGELGLLRVGAINPDVITPNHIIDYLDSGQNTCPGDSGGPIIASFVNSITGEQVVGLVGLTSSGTGGTCTNVETAFYTNVQEPNLVSFIVSAVPDVALF